MEINTQFRVVLISLIQGVSRVFTMHLFPCILGRVAAGTKNNSNKDF